MKGGIGGERGERREGTSGTRMEKCRKIVEFSSQNAPWKRFWGSQITKISPMRHPNSIKEDTRVRKITLRRSKGRPGNSLESPWGSLERLWDVPGVS